MIVCTHAGIFTDSRFGDPEWMDLHEESQEQAARRFKNPFRVLATHGRSQSYEVTDRTAHVDLRTASDRL